MQIQIIGAPIDFGAGRRGVEMGPAAAEQWMAGRAAGLMQEDLFFTFGLLREVPGYTPAHLHGALAGASRGLPLEQRGELAGFAARVYPQQARQILKSSAADPAALTPVLGAVLRGLEGASPGIKEGVLQQALEMGITKPQSEDLLRELKANPLQCD